MRPTLTVKPTRLGPFIPDELGDRPRGETARLTASSPALMTASAPTFYAMPPTTSPNTEEDWPSSVSEQDDFARLHHGERDPAARLSSRSTRTLAADPG